MTEISINETDIKISTVWKSIYDDFMEQLKSQENKYPLSEREQMFVTVIKKLLKELDYLSAIRTHCSENLELIGDD